MSGSSLCNQLQDCRDGSDEEQCDYPSSMLVFASTPPPAVVHFDGRGNYSFQPMADFSHCPETHFQCQGDKYAGCVNKIDIQIGRQAGRQNRQTEKQIDEQCLHPGS